MSRTRPLCHSALAWRVHTIASTLMVTEALVGQRVVEGRGQASGIEELCSRGVTCGVAVKLLFKGGRALLSPHARQFREDHDAVRGSAITDVSAVIGDAKYFRQRRLQAESTW